MKIVVTGPPRAGTTSLIRSVSEIAVLTTERRVVGAKGPLREAAVPMDFGRVTVGDRAVIYLFGTPSEEDLSLESGPFAEEPIGIVVMCDPLRVPSVERAGEIVRYLRAHSDIPFVVAANMRAGAQIDDSDIEMMLALDDPAPTVRCIATERDSSLAVVKTLLQEALRVVS